MEKEEYRYDYANKCDCSEDDNCGCTFPNNMKQNFSCEPVSDNKNLQATSQIITD